MTPAIPPIESEFIGLILQTPVSVNEFADRVPPDAFANAVTRAVWEGMTSLARSGTQVSIPALRETVLIDVERFGIPNLPAFLATSMSRATGELGLSDVADMLADRAMKARLSATLAEIQQLVAKDTDESGEELALKAAKMLEGVTAATKSREAMTIYEAAQQFQQQVTHSYQDGEPMGHDWGLRELDRIMGTIQPGDFGVLGGPSGHGKSALAMQIAMHIARRLPVLMIQAEMRHADVAGREVLGMSGVSSEVVESGRMQASEVEAVIAATAKLQGLPFEIVYSGDMRVSKIRTRIQSFLYRWQGCGLVIIDTIKHVDPEDKGARTLVDRIVTSAKKLDGLAKQLDVPIMALAQVKEVYFERPQAALYINDLYGGGDLREAASWVLLMHQPALKLNGQSGGKAEGEAERWAGKAQVIAGKRRRGKPGRGELEWIDSRTRFCDPGDSVTETFL